jgi:nucleoside-diphosphate-sugar epimerase
MCDTLQEEYLLDQQGPILVTGAAGFIGSRLVENLLSRGFCNVRCLVRSPEKEASANVGSQRPFDGLRARVIQGNLLSEEDCLAATKDVAVIYHLAAARGEKSFPGAFLNSVVTTRNLLDASRRNGCLRRFVNVSSFAVYSNLNKPSRRILDESCPVHSDPGRLGDAYSFAKVKQDELVAEYGRRFGIPYVIVRPGWVYGPGNESITGRVGMAMLGVFLHLGGSNTIPFTYVDNCADAIAVAGLKKGVDEEIFNVIDDDLRSSFQFLASYKEAVGTFRSIYVPHVVSYALCRLWEGYSNRSEGQLPRVYNRGLWHSYWKKTRYSNEKLKDRLGWVQRVPTDEALRRYFDACRHRGLHA